MSNYPVPKVYHHCMIVAGLNPKIEHMDQQLVYRLMIHFRIHPLFAHLALSMIKDIVLLEVKSQEVDTQDLNLPEDTPLLLLLQEAEIGIPRTVPLLAVLTIHMFNPSPLVVLVIEVPGMIGEDCPHEATPEKITLGRDGAVVKTREPLLRRDRLQRGLIFARSL